MDQQASPPNPPAKTPVHRGARACMVCRAAKMKCVGAEDGSRCQRCQRAGVDCVFEKHRRGRKPGSKLSEASKMLRRLEKGLNNAKAKQPANSALSQPSSSTAQYGPDEGAGPSTSAGPSTHAPQNYDEDMDEDEDDRPEEALYPEKVIRSSHKSSFLDIVMNPEPPAADSSRPRSGASSSERAHSLPKAGSQSPTRAVGSPQPKPYTGLFNGYVPRDPVAAGVIHESEVGDFFDLFFLRLNPFINLFDPMLHSADYVRSRSPFLFTAMLMACCKFFKTELYHTVRRLAEEWCVFTFAEGTESVETAQALACMTYWEEPSDRRTWSYIGMACRMSVNLRLNKYVGRRQSQESALHFLERRNRERTYLVLFVHDRSLSMQTGKPWMLPEDDLVRNCRTWHEDGCAGARPEVRPEDVIVAAFVHLRLIGSEASDTFYKRANAPTTAHSTMTFESELYNYNSKLDRWSEIWEEQLRQCKDAHVFHSAFIQFFQSHVRLFLNTFGLNPSNVDHRPLPNSESVRQCYQSASKNLQIITEFDKLHVLPYCQESITVMTAYAAIVLLRLLRGSNTVSYMADGAVEQVHGVINSAADAYQHASHITGSDIDCAAYHARFLRRLVTFDLEKARPQHDHNSFRQDGIPPLFAQSLPPLRSAQPSSVQNASQQDYYSLPRAVPSHAAPLPPLSLIGPTSHALSGFTTHGKGPMDTVSRNGLSHTGTRMPAVQHSPTQVSTEADDSYMNYILGEFSESGQSMFLRGDGSPTNGGFLSNLAAPTSMADFGYSSSSSHYREPQYPHAYGGHPQTQSRPVAHSYLPPVQSFSHASYDGPR